MEEVGNALVGGETGEVGGVFMGDDGGSEMFVGSKTKSTIPFSAERYICWFFVAEA